MYRYAITITSILEPFHQSKNIPRGGCPNSYSRQPLICLFHISFNTHHKNYMPVWCLLSWFPFLRSFYKISYEWINTRYSFSCVWLYPLRIFLKLIWIRISGSLSLLLFIAAQYPTVRLYHICFSLFTGRRNTWMVYSFWALWKCGYGHLACKFLYRHTIHFHSPWVYS